MKGLRINGVPIQAFIPDPSKSLVSSSTGTIVFDKGVSGDVDITGDLAILVRPSAASSYYYNADTAKTKALDADKDNIIYVGQANVQSVTVALSTATADIQRM